MGFRKEIKYRFPANKVPILRAHLQGKGLTMLHADRKIASIYFDTNQQQSFSDSEEGLLPRSKLRGRWYNDKISKIYWEKKITAFEGRFKTTEQIPATVFSSYYASGFVDTLYGLMTPMTEVTYMRSYFQLADLRLTLDEDIRYKNLRTGRIAFEEECVVELKAPADAETDFIGDFLGFSPRRFSKFCNSVQYT